MSQSPPVTTPGSNWQEAFNGANMTFGQAGQAQQQQQSQSPGFGVPGAQSYMMDGSQSQHTSPFQSPYPFQQQQAQMQQQYFAAQQYAQQASLPNSPPYGLNHSNPVSNPVSPFDQTSPSQYMQSHGSASPQILGMLQQQQQQQQQLHQHRGSGSASPFQLDSRHASKSPPLDIQIPASAGLSASSLAYLATGGGGHNFENQRMGSNGSDPTQVIYDENTGGYATPSYAGSYADDSSFDDPDRRSHSPFSRPASIDTRNSGDIGVPPLFGMNFGNPSAHIAMAGSSSNGVAYGGEKDLSTDPVFGSQASDLLAFRERFGGNGSQNPSDWGDDASSAAGGVSRGGNGGGSVHSFASHYSDASPNLAALNDQDIREDDFEGNGLEMAVERMFAPLPSPKIYPATATAVLTSQQQQGLSPQRDDTLRATTAPLPPSLDDPSAPNAQQRDASRARQPASGGRLSASRSGSASRGLLGANLSADNENLQVELEKPIAFTASPDQSPRMIAEPRSSSATLADDIPSLDGQQRRGPPPLPGVPSISTFSPSPSKAEFGEGPSRQTTEDGQLEHPIMKSPPIPGQSVRTSSGNGNGNENKLSRLAIPLKPDLTLTTATPTAVPRTATSRQDSTQMALDTVFAQFFDKSQRKDSTDSLPHIDLHTLQSVPEHDLTIGITPTQYKRHPLRQRSKSDTYMTSPLAMHPEGSSASPFSTAGSPFQPKAEEEHEGLRSASQTRGREEAAQPRRQTSGIDPRELSGTSSNGSDSRHASASPGRRASALIFDDDVGDGIGGSEGNGTRRQRDSQVGPASSSRRRSMVGTPYDAVPLYPAQSGGVHQPAGTANNYLVPPTPGSMRRSRSHETAHRRGTRSEDLSGLYSQSASVDGFPRLPNSAGLAPDTHFAAYLQQMQQAQTVANMHSGMPPDSAAFYQQHFNVPAIPHPAMDPNNPAFLAAAARQFGSPLAEDAGPGGGAVDPNLLAMLQAQAQLYGTPQQQWQMAYQNALNMRGSEHSQPANQHLNPYQGGPPSSSGSPYYHPLESEDDNSGLFPVDHNKQRRRSSVRSDTSGLSGLSEGVTLESKTTEATKQAARRRRKDPNSAKFACEYCGETFTRAYNLKGHIRSHEGIKPFECSVCRKGFARRHDLKRHELLHTGVKKYQCEACQTPFVRLDALQRHHKSEGGAACVVQITEMAEMRGVDLSTLTGGEPPARPSPPVSHPGSHVNVNDGLRQVKQEQHNTELAPMELHLPQQGSNSQAQMTFQQMFGQQPYQSPTNSRGVQL